MGEAKNSFICLIKFLASIPQKRDFRAFIFVVLKRQKKRRRKKGKDKEYTNEGQKRQRKDKRRGKKINKRQEKRKRQKRRHLWRRDVVVGCWQLVLDRERSW